MVPLAEHALPGVVMAPPSLTILVPTNDRPEVLARVWRSWLGQEGLAQVVIVDDGSVHDYTRVLADIDASLKQRSIELRVIRLAHRTGAAAARNMGLAACTSEEILTLDDDILLTSTVVADCRAARPASVDPVIVGPRVVYVQDHETEAEADARSGQDQRPYFDRSRLTLVPWVRPLEVLRVPFVTAVALWPRALFDHGLRYFEGYRGNGYREETDPQVQAQARHRAEVHFVPSAKVFHLPPRLAYAQKGGQRRYNLLAFEWHVAKNNALFLGRHGRFLSRRFGAKPVASWTMLSLSRLSPRRLQVWIRRRLSSKSAETV